jgi:hypothetical protein
MYAVLHLARSEQEAVRFLQVTVELLASGGRALIGSVPLEDLQVDWPSGRSLAGGRIARLAALGRWMASPGSAPVRLTRRWKARHVLRSVIKGRSDNPDFVLPRLPPNYTLPLTTTALERWLAPFGDELRYEWALPAPGVPLAAARADLIVVRR